MRFTFKRCICIVIFLYVIISVCVIYYFLFENLYDKALKATRSELYDPWSSFTKSPVINSSANFLSIKKVEIWGKAAIGHFLWTDIIGGNISEDLNGLKQGQLLTDGIHFYFKSGPNLIPSKDKLLNSNIDVLILVLNGREEKKIAHACKWLDWVCTELADTKIRIFVIMLGSESCDNHWLDTYTPISNSNMTPLNKDVLIQNKHIERVFVTYDVNEDGVYTQWPLGTATYRNFPPITSQRSNHLHIRRCRCGFHGTVYANSSRVALLKVLKENNNFNGECITSSRQAWLPLETNKSLSNHVDSLLGCDLTLCPVGYNSETYRIFEALEMGSVPVVEDRFGILGRAECIHSSTHPFHLFKKYKAPFIYVNEWAELIRVIDRERMLSKDEIINRRVKLVKWYKIFRKKMFNKLINNIINI